MTTKLSRLLREAAEDMGERFATPYRSQLRKWLLAEADRLDAHAPKSSDAYMDEWHDGFGSGWLAACGGEEKG